MKLFVEAYLRVMLGGTVDVLIERSLKNGVLALVLHTAVVGFRVNMDGRQEIRAHVTSITPYDLLQQV
jgi:hypothetical protein